MITIYKTFWHNEWRWRIKASNGKIIGASSDGYKNRVDCVANLRILYKALDDNYEEIW